MILSGKEIQKQVIGRNIVEIKKRGSVLDDPRVIQLYHLNREIEQEKRRLQELEAAATDTAVKISGLPHVGGISDKTAIAAQIADCRGVVESENSTEYG